MAMSLRTFSRGSPEVVMAMLCTGPAVPCPPSGNPTGRCSSRAAPGAAANSPGRGLQLVVSRLRQLRDVRFERVESGDRTMTWGSTTGPTTKKTAELITL